MRDHGDFAECRVAIKLVDSVHSFARLLAIPIQCASNIVRVAS